MVTTAEEDPNKASGQVFNLQTQCYVLGGKVERGSVLIAAWALHFITGTFLVELRAADFLGLNAVFPLAISVL